MKKQIIKITPFQTAKIMASLWFVISLPFVAFIGLALISMPTEARNAFSGMVFFFPFFYLVFGFIFTWIGSWVYNILAKYLGGIEYESIDAP